MGGYGREELSPYSDVDLLILHPPGKIKHLEDHLQAILHPLWDWGLTVGHTVQTPKESLRAAHKDLDLFFSFLDARWIAGDKGTYLHWREEFGKVDRRQRNGDDSRDPQERRKRGMPAWGIRFLFSSPISRKEKEDFGIIIPPSGPRACSRRIQAVEGMPDSGLLSPKEWQNYSRSLDFLWRVRNQLHYYYGRREDRLSFDDQESIASSLGYRGENPFLATESFLKDYFRQTLQIYRLSWNVLDKCLEDQTGKPKGWGTGAPLEIAPGFSLYHGRLTLTDANPVQSESPCISGRFSRSSTPTA